MDKLKIQGGNVLNGDLIISGSKNMSLTLLSSTLLNSEETILLNIPSIADVVFMQQILIDLGADLNLIQCGKDRSLFKMAIKFDEKLKTNKVDYNLVKKMRASILLLGPMLTRYKKCSISLPGGCNIGSRPVDLHLDALKKLGAEIELEGGYINASCKKLIGNKIEFSKYSVGATANTLMAASLAKGETFIKNASTDPDVIALIDLLILMGAKIERNEREIYIQGVDNLKTAEYKIKPDRMELMSYICMTAASDGELNLLNCSKDELLEFKDQIDLVGISVIEINNGLNVKRKDKKLNPVKLKTGVYPEFSTDCQAPFTSVLCLADGISEIEESVFENRFMHIPELIRMGANIEIKGKKIIIKGVNSLHGANIMASDLRGGFGLLIAGLSAKGDSTLERIYHIERGYQDFISKINNCNGNLTRIKM